MPTIKSSIEEIEDIEKLQKNNKISAADRIVKIFKQLYGRPDNKPDNSVTNTTFNRSLDNDITIGYFEVLEDNSFATNNTTITIDVNGRKCSAMPNQIVSYVDIIRLAFDKTYTVIKTKSQFDEQYFDKQVYPMDNIDFTVLYTRGYQNTSGVLIRNKSIKLVNGMHFSVALTNNA